MNALNAFKWTVDYRDILGTGHVAMNSLDDLGCELFDDFCQFAAQHQKVLPAFTPISRGMLKRLKM